MTEPAKKLCISAATLRTGDSRRLLLLLRVLIVVGLAYLLYRGVYEGVAGGGYDWEMIYGGSRAMLEGQNPYNYDQVITGLEESGSLAEDSRSRRHPDQFMLLYPPPTYLVMAPLALLPADASYLTWLALSTLLLIPFVLVLRTLSKGLETEQPNGSAEGGTSTITSRYALELILVAVLFFAPIHTGLRFGQTTLVALLLSLLALLGAKRNHPWLAAICLTLALVLKFQVAGIFWFVLLVNKHWRVPMISLLGTLAITALAVWRLESIAPDWYMQWRANLDYFSTHLASIGPTNPVRWQLLTLGYPLEVWLGNENLAHILCWLTVFVGLLWSLAVYYRKQVPQALLWLLAMLCVLSFAVTYRRTYDAVLLFPALAWIIAVWPRLTPRWPMVVMLAALAVFLVPGSGATYVLGKRLLSDAMFSHPLWYGLVLAHQVWAIFVIGLMLAILPVVSRRAKTERQDASGGCVNSRLTGAS